MCSHLATILFHGFSMTHNSMGELKETPTSDQSDPTKQQTHIYTMMTGNFVSFFPHWKPKTGTNDFLVAAATPITVWDSCCAVLCIYLYTSQKGGCDIIITRLPETDSFVCVKTQWDEINKTVGLSKHPRNGFRWNHFTPGYCGMAITIWHLRCVMIIIPLKRQKGEALLLLLVV